MTTTTTRPARADDKPAIWQLYESAMKHHIEEMWGCDARELSLRVFRTNAGARRFYEREGWRVVADEGDFSRMIPGAVPTFGHGLIDTELFRICRQPASGMSAAAGSSCRQDPAQPT
jgi:hypothetical protein